MAKPTESTLSSSVAEAHKLPGQVVLVLQGGGALGAYQGGIYEALHEAGIEPNWVIGTSIGAINAGIIAGNPTDKRLDQLREFWSTMEYKPWWENSPYFAPWLGSPRLLADFTNQSANMMALFGGVSGYYTPNHALTWGGAKAALGVERAALYDTKDRAGPGNLDGRIGGVSA
jgi:NTE family protein